MGDPIAKGLQGMVAELIFFLQTRCHSWSTWCIYIKETQEQKLQTIFVTQFIIKILQRCVYRQEAGHVLVYVSYI